MDTPKQEAELQGLLAEGRALQKTLATATADHGAYMEKCIEASERILAAAKSVATASVSTQTALEGVEEASTVSTARAPGGHAIVLVLVDATSHQFLNDLYRNKMSGGAETGKRLRAAVGERVAATLPAIERSGYHIVIKIFACLKTLSTRAAAVKLASPEPRSLGFHFGEFTKVSSFFDFVDTGDEGHVPKKITENFKFYMADPNCKHVFFAAANSPLYRRALHPYRGQVEKVTIVGNTYNNGGLYDMGFPLADFGTVFFGTFTGPVKAGGTAQVSTTPRSVVVGTRAKALSLSDRNISTSRVAIEAGLQVPAVMSYENKLPCSYIDGRLPVNAAEQRIDIYVRKPSVADFNLYKALYSRYKLCHRHCLGATCTTAKCQYYHRMLEPGAYRALQYEVLCNPCQHGARCRFSHCLYGHVCQNDECAKAGKKVKRCLFPASMHGMDLEVSHWVLPLGTQVKDEIVLAAPAKMEDLRPFDAIENLIDFD